MTKRDKYLLIGANVATIIFAVAQQWNIADLVYFYIFASIIIGLFTILRLLIVQTTPSFNPQTNKTGNVTLGLKIFLAAFFVIHYGGFHAFYFFDIADFLGVNFDSNWDMLLIPLGLFFVQQVVLFFEQKSITVPTDRYIRIMFLPYARIIPIHLIIFIGAAISIFLDAQSIVIVIIFILLKMFIEMLTGGWWNLSKFLERKMHS